MRYATKILQATSVRALFVVVSLAILGFSIYWSGFRAGDQIAAAPAPAGASPAGTGYQSPSHVNGPSSNDLAAERRSSDTPFPGAERVDSVAQAQARVGFEIPFPPALAGEWAPVEVWAPAAGQWGDEHIRIIFANGVSLSVDNRSRPNIRAVVEDSGGELQLVKVGQWDGKIYERRTVLVWGRPYENPSSVGWWQNNTYVALISKAHSSVDLLRMAEQFARAPVGELQPEPIVDGGVPVPPPPPSDPSPSRRRR